MLATMILRILGKSEDSLIEEFADYINMDPAGDLSEGFADVIYDDIPADFGGREHSIREWAEIKKALVEFIEKIEPEAVSRAEEINRDAIEDEREFIEARTGQY